MRSHHWLAWISLVLLLVACGAQPGKTTITYPKSDEPPPPIEARQRGVYYLFAANSPNALYSIELSKGEQYGFKKRTDGKIVGFAKDKEIPLANSLTTSYFWKFNKEE